MTLGQRLKYSRKKNKLTHAQVEEQTGITQSYLSKLERDERQNPSFDVVSSLAKLYDVDFTWLIGGVVQELNENDSIIRRKKQKISEMINYVNEEDLDKIIAIIEVFIKEEEG